MLGREFTIKDTMHNKWLEFNLTNTDNFKSYIDALEKGILDMNTLRPFIGILDKDQNKVYEGDIVKVESFDHYDLLEEHTGEVKYSAKNGCFQLNDDVDFIGVRGAEVTRITKLGNIYELQNSDITQKLEKEHIKNDSEIKKELARSGFDPEKKLVKCMRNLQEVFERPISVFELKEFQKQINSNEKLNAVKEAVTAFQESEKMMARNMEQMLQR